MRVEKGFILIFALLVFTVRSEIEPENSIYCSLIEDKDSCNKNKNCMFVEISFQKFYKALDQRKMCYSREFIVNSMKARIFPTDFMSISNSKLVKEAKFEQDLDLSIPKNIVTVMTKLIELNKIDFIHSITLSE